jgi:hypothetical protein
MSELRVKSTGTLKLFESDNTSSVTIASPASLGADRTITLPDASVTLASGTMLATDGDGSSLTGLPDNTPYFAAYATADTTISDATDTTIIFGTEDFDSDSAFSSTTFTVPAGMGGYYFLSVTVQVYGGATDGLRDAVVYINGGSGGTTVLTRATLGFQSNREETLTLHCNGVFNLAAADLINSTVNIDNVGGTSSYGGGSHRKTMISGFRIIS